MAQHERLRGSFLAASVTNIHYYGSLSLCFCIFSLHITGPNLCKSQESLKVQALSVSSAALSVRSEVNPLSESAAVTTAAQ